MAYYEMMPAGLPAGLQSGMDSVLNKKFGTATSYAPGTWPDTINLMGPLPERTATGSIAHITDGADEVPIKSWDVEIAPTLTGKSAVETTVTGKNVRQNVTDYSSANPVFFQYRNYYAGQATGYPKLEGTFKAGTYTLSFDTTASITASRVGVWAKKKSDQNWYNLSANGDLVTPTSSGYSFCSVSEGHVTGTFKINEDCDALGFGYYQYGTSIPYTNLMLEVGSSASAYVPYQTPEIKTVNLGRTIYGGTADVVNGTGSVSYAYIDLSQVAWTNFATSGNRLYINTAYPNIKKPATNADMPECLCNCFPTITRANMGYSAPFTMGITIDRDGLLIIANPDDATWTSKETAVESLSQMGAMCAIPLATPTDFTFTPITPTPETALGTNNFWADEGDTEVTYRADINLALQALSGSRGLMMARPQLEPETEPEETIEETPEEMER